MSAGGFDPALVAKADQQRAATADNVTRAVAFYRQEIARHDGDTMCAWGHLGAVVLHDTGHNPVYLAEILVGCVDRIAKLEQELGR